MGVAHDVYEEVRRKFPGAKITRVGKPVQWSQDDINVTIKAGRAGGAYIDALGKKTPEMTYDEYMGLINAIICAWDERFAKRELDRFDIVAITEAGKAGGEYIEALGKELEACNGHEYNTFVETVIAGWIDNAIPF